MNEKENIGSKVIKENKILSWTLISKYSLKNRSFTSSSRTLCTYTTQMISAHYLQWTLVTEERKVYEPNDSILFPQHASFLYK